MTRAWRGVGSVALVLALVWGGASCGGGSGGEEVREAPAEGYAEPARSAIPDRTEPEVPVPGTVIAAYFDEAGERDSLAVAPGERFRVYVFVSYGRPYRTNAVQFSLGLPDGVRVVGYRPMEAARLSYGEPETNYMVSYECADAGRFFVAVCDCEVGEGFGGGEVRVLPGVARNGEAFLGLATCPEPKAEKVPAAGASARLARR